MKMIIEKCEKKTKREKQNEKIYIKKCWNCKSKFTYQKEDIQTHLGFDPDYWEDVECPVCYHRCDIGFIKRRYREKKDYGKMLK